MLPTHWSQVRVWASDTLIMGSGFEPPLIVKIKPQVVGQREFTILRLGLRRIKGILIILSLDLE